MRIRSGIFVAALGLFAGACGGARAGRIMADTPVLPYQAPDADEIAGIDPDAEPDATETTPPPATDATPATPAQNPHK